MQIFEVTVTATGSVFVNAENAEAARTHVNENLTMAGLTTFGSWSDDSPIVTDVTEAETDAVAAIDLSDAETPRDPENSMPRTEPVTEAE